MSGGSTTSEAVCHAAELAAKQLLKQLLPFKTELTTEDCPEPAWKAITAAAWGGGGGATQDGTPNLTASKQYSTDGTAINPAGYFGLGAGCSEVEVDMLTGSVTTLRTDILYDCGHSLNPVIDIGQAEGAYVMGLGFFLQEETMYNKATGELVSDGTWEYVPFRPGWSNRLQ